MSPDAPGAKSVFTTVPVGFKTGPEVKGPGSAAVSDGGGASGVTPTDEVVGAGDGTFRQAIIE